MSRTSPVAVLALWVALVITITAGSAQAAPGVTVTGVPGRMTEPADGDAGGPARGAAVPDTRSASPFVAEWSWPIRPTPRVLRVFEKPPKPWQRGHRGVDLAVGPGGGDAVGGPILSPESGIVSFAGTVVDRGVLSIDHGDGRVSSFEPVSTDLVKGGTVLKGDVIATLAPTTAATGPWHCASPCVHWGVRVDGEYVDPLAFVMDRRPSILLPLEG